MRRAAPSNNMVSRDAVNVADLRRVKKWLPNFKLKKELGQNFLVDTATIQRLVAYAHISPSDSALEIGAGPGNISEEIAAVAQRVYAIEIDKRFSPILSDVQSRWPNLEIIMADATTISFPVVDKVIANLPFNVALPLIFQLVAHGFHTGTFVIQRDLARRLAARPGAAGYGRVSVTLQRVASVRLLEVVCRERFRPLPEVDSAIVRIRPIRPAYKVPDEDYFRRFLDVVFSRRDDHLGLLLRSLKAPANAVRKILNQLPSGVLRQSGTVLSGAHLGEVAAVLYAARIELPAPTPEEKRKAQKLFRTKKIGQRQLKRSQRRR